MKILVFLTYYHPHWTGLTAYAKRMAEGLAASGHTVTVITAQHTPELPLSETINGVQVKRLRPMGRLSRGVIMPSFPVVPYPPFIAPVPLPVKYRLHFGEPMRFTGDPDDDDEILDEKVKQVRNRIQSMIHIGLREREHVFW
jgi:1-acyl-sn-glycerol-3-phosphate acyltransferase